MLTIDGNSDNHIFDETMFLARAQGGDDKARDALITRYRDDIQYYLRRQSRTTEDAEDLLQDVLIDAHKSLHRFRGESSFLTWLRSIAQNHLKNYYARVLAKQGRLEPLDKSETENFTEWNLVDRNGPETAVVSRNYCEDLLSVLPLACSEIESQVIVLVYQGRNYSYIGTLLNKPEPYIAQSFRRGRSKLFAYLVEHDPDMLGGDGAIADGWQKACSTTDLEMKPTPEEIDAWNKPHGNVAMFRNAVLKLIRFLPLVGLLLGIQQGFTS